MTRDPLVLALAPGVELRLRPIPAGRFRMGSRGFSANEEPPHEVRIPPIRDRDGAPLEHVPAFWLGETPVTQAELEVWTGSDDYRAWLGEHGEAYDLRGPHENHFSGRASCPADSVSWWESRAYCQWLQRRDPSGLCQLAALPEGWALRASLPSEAYWEYACRAGTTSEYHTGDGEGALRQAGWFEEDWESGSTHPVAECEPNPWGLFDLHGNVWEWCADVWVDEPYRSRIDGADAESPLVALAESAQGHPLRVIRGGSWNVPARFCRSAYRHWVPPSNRNLGLGFRVCLLPGPAGQPVSRGAPPAEDRGRDGERGVEPSGPARARAGGGG